MLSSYADPKSSHLDPDNPWPGLDSFEEHARKYFHGRDAADGTLRVWNIASGDELRRTGVKGCDRLAFGPDGIRLAEVGLAGLSTVVRQISGGSLLDISRSRGEQLQSVYLSANGRRFAANDVAGRLTVWELGEANDARQLMKVDRSRFSPFALSADGDRAAIVAEGMVHVLDLRSPARPIRSIRADDPFELALSPDGSLLAISAPDGLRVWNVSTGDRLPALAAKANSFMTFSFPDGHYLATIADGMVTVWETTTGKSLQAWTGRSPVAFSADGERIAAATDATAVTIWDVKSGNPVTKLYGIGESVIRAVALNNDASHVATASADGRIRVWDTTTGQPKVTVREQAPIDLVALTADRVAAWAQDRVLTVWHSDADGGARAVPSVERVPEVFDMNFVAGGDRLLTAGRSGERLLTLWDVLTGRPSPAPYATKQPRFGRVLAFAFSLEEKRIAVSTTDGVSVLDAASGQVLLEIDGSWYDVVLSGPNGEWLAISDQNRTEAWDVRSRRRMNNLAILSARPTFPPGRRMALLAFRNDGRLLATVDRDEHTIVLWDSRTGARQTALYRHDGRVRAIAFTPDGKHLTAVTEDWTVHHHPLGIPDLMSLARSRVKRSLTSEECQKYLSTPQCRADSPLESLHHQATREDALI